MSKRGRPRKFNENTVNEAMTDLFLRQGFAATSLDDIAAATNLNRPSLYRVFGNKDEMYLGCLKRFVNDMTDLSDHVFQGAGSLEAALEAFYLGLIEHYFPVRQDETALGCLVFSNAISEAPSNDRIKSFIASTLAEIREDLRKNIALHYPDCVPEVAEAAVELSLSVFLALGVRARAGQDRHEVERATLGSVAAIVSLLF